MEDGKKISIDSATNEQNFWDSRSSKTVSIPNKKLDILIHPNSLVHAIIHLKNGLIKFLYHETTMMIPLANAIFDGNLNMENFYKRPKIQNLLLLSHLYLKIDEKKFPLIKLKNKIIESSTDNY